MKSSLRNIYLIGLGAIAFGGALLAHLAQEVVVGHFLDAYQFELADLYRAGSQVAIAGSLLSVGGLAWLTRNRFQQMVKIEARNLLMEALGRDGFPVDYRAAIAYVIQEMEQ